MCLPYARHTFDTLELRKKYITHMSNTHLILWNKGTQATHMVLISPYSHACVSLPYGEKRCAGTDLNRHTLTCVGNVEKSFSFAT